MANLKKVVSFIVSHPRNKFKGTFTTHSSLFSVRKTSSFLEVGTGICPPKMNFFVPFYSTFGPNSQSFLIPPVSTHENDDNEEKPWDYRFSIEKACNDGRIFEAINLLNGMVRIGYEPSVYPYTSIIDSFFKSGLEYYALKIFIEMAFHRGIVPECTVTYNTLLHCLRILSRKDDITQLLKDMEDKGINVLTPTYNMCVDAYCKEGLMEEAESLVKLMTKRWILHPDTRTYRWLIEGYCLQGKVNKAREVFDLMRRTRRVQPHIEVYHNLLNGYFKDSKTEEAMCIFDEMMKNGVEYKVISYDSMGLLRVGDPAQAIFGEVPIPDECTFKIVLEGLCNNNRVEEAVSLFNSLGDKELNSNIAMYNVLIDGACKSGNLGIARIFYSDLTTKGLQPDGVTYAAMINGFCQEGLVGEARELFFEMKEKDVPLDNVTCDVLRQGFLKIQQLDIVEMLEQEVERRRIYFKPSTELEKQMFDGYFSSGF